MLAPYRLALAILNVFGPAHPRPAPVPLAPLVDAPEPARPRGWFLIDTPES